MLDAPTSPPGVPLTLDAYSEDFDRRFKALRGEDTWKLERLQEFHQPENPSWMRYLSGEPQEALRMLEEDRPALHTFFADLAARDSRVLRLRVVDTPLTPYLYWELHSLHIRAQCGEHIRVIGSGALADLERDGALPEVLTLGERAAYRILYDGGGEISGGVLYTDPGVVVRCRDRIAALYADAEPLTDYFAREVAPLEAPRV